MRRFQLAASTTALSFCLLLAGCDSSATQQVATKEINGSLVSVKSVAVYQNEVKRTTAQPATVYPYYETEIQSRVTGYVSEIFVDIGDVVKTGDPLIKIDVPDLERQRETLKAQVNLLSEEEQETLAGVALADATVNAARAKLEQAKSELSGVEALLVAADAEFSRTKELVDRGSLQSRMLDEVRKNRDSVQASKESLLSAVTAAQAEIDVAAAEKSAAEARMKVAKARTEVATRQLAELEEKINFAVLVAPFDGVITKRYVNLGDLIKDQTSNRLQPLVNVSKLDKVRLHIPVPESDAPFVQPGDTVTLTFPAFADEPPISAAVTRRTGSLDAGSRTMIIEVEIENTNNKLFPGMFGQATVELDTKIAARMLPSRAVRFDEAGKAFVYVIGEDSQVSLKEIVAGIDTGTEIEILEGLQPGDRVIGPHLKRFVEGQKVQILN